jgi:mercuric ion transport protein
MTTATRQNRMMGFLSLFTSFGTLLCCALPSLLVVLGLGATVASFLSAVPWLVTLSQHKGWVFAFSGLLIGANFLYVYRVAPRLKASGAAGEACSLDAPDACDTAGRFSRATLWASAAIWAIGFFVAFVLGPLLMRFDS